jgi:uncharacterized membrane protein
MKYPGDIIYFLMYVGPDALLVALAVLVIVVAAIWYSLSRKKKIEHS